MHFVVWRLVVCASVEEKTFVFSFLGAINKMCTHGAGKIELIGLRLGLSACWFAACVVFNFVRMCSGDRYFLSWPRGGICFTSLFASFLLWGVIKKKFAVVLAIIPCACEFSFNSWVALCFSRLD